MYYMRMTIRDTLESCMEILPDHISGNPDIELETTQCMCKDEGGCSMIRISDPKGILKEDIIEHETFINERGECSIERVSSNKLLAMVINKKCPASRIISESGCLLVSSKMVAPLTVSFAVVSGRKIYLYDLLKRLKDLGYDVEKEMSTFTTYESILSNKQEETLRVALESGYYDIPKKINTEELAEKLNCTRSTVNTTLRNGEKKLIQYYFMVNKNNWND